MGQRHQLYILIIVNGELICIGLHNQWLFGCIALEMLIRILSVISKSVSESNVTMCNDEAEVLIRNLNAENGCGNWVSWNPLNGDNNNGITIIDARNASKPKYCFMSIHSYTECLDARLEDTSRILAEEEDEGRGEGIVRYQPSIGYPLSGSDYVDLHYHPDEGSEKFVFILGLKEKLKDVALLSPAECFDIFPEIYEGIDLEKYSTFWKLHNDPREMAWERRKNFIMFLFTIGYRVTASSAVKRVVPVEIVPKDGVCIEAQNRVFYDEGGMVQFILKFL